MRKYKRIKPKKPKRKVKHSIYKSNINKQNVKVNIMGTTPSLGGSILHMHIPYSTVSFVDDITIVSQPGPIVLNENNIQTTFEYDKLYFLFCDYSNEAAEVRRSTFTPIIASCEGIFDHEAQIYMKRMSTLLASKWGKSYSQVHGWLKARMQVCILRSVSLCIRGSRTQWRGAGIEHGAQISLYCN